MKIIFFILFICLNWFSFSQESITRVTMDGSNPSRDSLIAQIKKSVAISKEDTNKVKLLIRLTGFYIYTPSDSALSYATHSLELSKKLHFKEGELEVLHYMGEALAIQGNYARALETQLEALRISEKIGDPILISETYAWMGNIYYYSADYHKALFYYNKAKSNEPFFQENQKIISGYIGESYFHLNQLDSAFLYVQKAYELDMVEDEAHWSTPSLYLGNIYLLKNQPEMALKYYRQAVQFFPGNNYAAAFIGLSAVFKKTGNIDSAIHYSKLITQSPKNYFLIRIIAASKLLTEIYKTQGNSDSAFKYQGIMLVAKDSLFSQEKVKQLENISFNEQIQQKEIEAEKARVRNRERIFALIGGVAFFLVIAIILFRNNRQKQKTNSLLQQQKEEIQTTLGELRSTQAQLIQQEKMASLGELTAGVAHEIQNPLNFVNNFSEVNKELISEMREEIVKGNYDQVNALAKDVEDNQEKINHHGKRADAIVKGMLQHSRSSSGVKEPTDINALADEYLRLAYHGLRAKDNSFNATIKTDFDKSIGNINIMPHDIGRVLLNLINNAFYAVSEKKKQQAENYEPTVSIKTKKVDGKIEVRIKDNGNGIPQKVLDKIFHPFFTTKPTGQGTGLGLSLAYDIAKAHGGELTVETKEGIGAVFIVLLPV